MDKLSPSVMSDSFVTSSIAACQASLSVEFPGQEHWSGLTFLPPINSMCVCIYICMYTCVCVFKVETHTLDVTIGEFTETSLMGKGSYNLKRLSVC